MAADQDMARIADDQPTLAAKIRALHAQGFKRSEIARFLQRDPTQVRNVIKADEMRRGRKPSPVESGEGVAQAATAAAGIGRRPGAPDQRIFRLEVDAEGRLTLPPQALDLLKARQIPVVMGELTDEGFILISAEESVRRVRAWIAATIPADVDLVEELLAERRREVELEASHG